MGEPPADIIACSVDGAPAVTAHREVPPDRARIELVSAARVTDDVRGQVGHDNEWLLEIV